jgi:hypothetical protein
MKHLIAGCLLSASLFAFTSCGDKAHDDHGKDSTASAAAPAEENDGSAAIKFNNVHDPEVDGKLVSIEGYIAPPDTSFITEDRVQLNFTESTGQVRSTQGLVVDMTVGTGKNTISKIALPYVSKDIKITGNSGEAIAVGDHVRITGKLTRYNDTFVLLEATKVKKI